MRVIIISILIIFINCQFGKCEELPKLFKSREFNIDDIANAANYYQGMGEKEAVLSLIRLAWDSALVQKRDFSIEERVFWIANILYKPRAPNNKLSYGALNIPKVDRQQLDWCYYPLVEIEGYFFVLDQGASGTGGETNVLNYFAVCQFYGKFRDTKIKILDNKGAKEKLDKFFVSKKWTELFTVDSEISLMQKGYIENFMRTQIPK